MKLAKKMLVGVLALAMVAALALTAFAASTINVAYSDAKIGEEMKVTVTASGATGLESANLTFKYDTSVLELVEVESADDGFIGEGGKAAEGEATLAVMYTKAAAKDDVALCTITFKVLKAGDATVDVVVESWDGIDDATVNNVGKEATSEADAEDPAPAPGADDTTAPEGSPATGEVGIAAIAGVMAIAAVAFVATRKKDEE